MQSLLLVALMLIFFSPAAYSAEKKIKALQIVQEEQTVGRLTIILCEIGCRMTWKREDYVCTCYAPKYLANLFSEKKGLIYTSDLTIWSKQCPHLRYDDFESGAGQITNTKWQGRPAEKGVFKVKQSDPLKEQYEFIYRDAKDRSQAHAHKEVIYCQDFKLNPQMRGFLEPYYRYPRMTALPVESYNLYPNHTQNQVLKTISVTPVEVTMADFVPPKDLKNTRLRDDIMNDSARRKMIPGVVEDIFGGK